MVLETITPNISCIQDLDFVMSDQIVWRHWEQSPFQSPLRMDNPMDVAQLDAMVQISSYLSFDMIDG